MGSGAEDCVGVDHNYSGFCDGGRGDFLDDTVGVSGGLGVVADAHPAIDRWATIGRPSGAGLTSSQRSVAPSDAGGF